MPVPIEVRLREQLFAVELLVFAENALVANVQRTGVATRVSPAPVSTTRSSKRTGPASGREDLEYLERSLMEHELIGLTDRELAPRIGRSSVE